MRKKLSLPGVEHMSSKGITQRWLFNSLGLILAILIVIELAMAFIVQDYYYSGIRWQLGNIMTTTQESFSRYANQSQSECVPLHQRGGKFQPQRTGGIAGF